MEAHLGTGHIAACMRITILAPQILHVAKDMSELILRHGLAEPAAETDVGDRRFLAVEPVEREILHHDNAAAIQEFTLHVGEHVAERRERKALPLDVDDCHARAPYRRNTSRKLLGIAIRNAIA